MIVRVGMCTLSYVRERQHTYVYDHVRRYARGYVCTRTIGMYAYLKIEFWQITQLSLPFQPCKGLSLGNTGSFGA